MKAATLKRSRCLAFEHLEGRALLSHAAGVFAAPVRVTALVNHHERAIRTNPAGVAAIVSALGGGPGSEFVSLIRREVHNLSSVISGFESGRITQYTIAGLAAKIPNWQPAYAGSPYDRMALTLAGAILLKGSSLELGAITRGPFAEDNATTTVAFAINRGRLETRALLRRSTVDYSGRTGHDHGGALRPHLFRNGDRPHHRHDSDDQPAEYLGGRAGRPSLREHRLIAVEGTLRFALSIRRLDVARAQ